MVDMTVPGWSNNPAGPTNPPPTESNYQEHPPGWSNVGPAATGATAGAPGSWTPTGALPVPTFTQMNAITATPATAWTTGQYVVLGDWSNAHWSGTAWASGKA